MTTDNLVPNDDGQKTQESRYTLFTLSGLAGDLWDDEADRLGDELALLPRHGLARLVPSPHLPRERAQNAVALRNLAGKRHKILREI